MAISSRATRMAVVEETTEGTLKAPSSTGEYLAVQDGLTLTPSFESLENAELKSSIGNSKVIQGLEQPNGSISHYMYHSGTEGVVPEMDLLLEGGFGAKSVAATEYDTVAGSSAGSATVAAAVNVDAGEGATFERGEALLLKDGVNGYSIRPIESIATDALTLGFNLSGAPASGVNLGKAVLYKPADTGHPSLSVWDYRGNGGAIQAVAGCKVSEMSLEASAGEFLNTSFSFDGTKFHFNPVEITSSDRYLDFTDDQGTVAAVVEAKFYRDPHELAAALETAMRAVSTETASVTYSDTTGKYTIKTTGTVLSLLWNTGANTANTIGDKIGFSVAADDTGVAATTGYTSDNAYTLTSPQTPALDGQDPFVAKANEVFIGNFDDIDCFCAQSITMTLSNEIANVTCVCSDSGVQEKVVNGRSVTVEITAILDPYEADKFRRFRANTETRFLYNFGNKSGGNWVAGQSGCLYIPKCTISSFELGDSEGVIVMNMTLSAYTASGEGEVFLNLL